MSKTKIATIVDDDGDVWTGKVIDKSSNSDILADMLFLGLPSLAGSTDDSVTVEVNGHEHSGDRVK